MAACWWGPVKEGICGAEERKSQISPLKKLRGDLEPQRCGGPGEENFAAVGQRQEVGRCDGGRVRFAPRDICSSAK